MFCFPQKYLLSLLFLLLSHPVWAQPADTLSPNNPVRNLVIKTNPLAMLWSQIPLTAEFRVMAEVAQTPTTSTLISFSYVYPSPLIQNQIDSLNQQLAPFRIRANGVRIQGQQRFYLFHEWLGIPKDMTPQGFYIGPHFSYNTIKVYLQHNVNNYFVKVHFMNLNLIGGLQLVYDRWVFDIYGGLGVRHNFINSKPGPGTQTIQQNIQLGINDFPQHLKIVLSTNIGLTF